MRCSVNGNEVEVKGRRARGHEQDRSRGRDVRALSVVRFEPSSKYLEARCSLKHGARFDTRPLCARAKTHPWAVAHTSDIRASFVNSTRGGVEQRSVRRESALQGDHGKTLTRESQASYHFFGASPPGLHRDCSLGGRARRTHELPACPRLVAFLTEGRGQTAAARLRRHATNSKSRDLRTMVGSCST